MRSRALLLVLSLLVAILACSSKPSSDSAANNDPNVPAADVEGCGKSPAPIAVPERVVVPAGTTLTVRLGQPLGSKISSPGQSFTATLADAVEVEGKTVIASGAEARGTVTDAKPLGKFKGGAVLQIRLNTIKVNGSEQAIETSAVTQAQKGKGKRPLSSPVAVPQSAQLSAEWLAVAKVPRSVRLRGVEQEQRGPRSPGIRTPCFARSPRSASG